MKTLIVIVGALVLMFALTLAASAYHRGPCECESTTEGNRS